jgi:hypothetical protein
MGASQSIKKLDSFASVCPGRRRLIRRLVTAALVIATAGPVILRAQGRGRILNIIMPPDMMASMATPIPTPQYLPAGYVLLGAYTGQSDGFGTGNAEVRIQYLNPKYIRSVFSPLTMYVSAMTENRFGGTADLAPELITLRIKDTTVEAQYFGGISAEPPQSERVLPNSQGSQWKSSSLNALVFPFDGFMIGIRGSKLEGVGRSELIRVAQSLTYTVRQ